MKPNRILAALACAACVVPAVAQTVSDPNLVVTPYLTGLSSPTGMVFSGADEGFVIEKSTGQVKRFAGGVLTAAPVLDLPVIANSERGLLGITLDPGFATNGYVYLYYSSNNRTGTLDGGNWVDNRVARFQWNGTALANQNLFRTFGTAADGEPDGANHNGGPILFGTDGKLYGTTGDLNRSLTEQNIEATGNASSNVGGIYRLNSDLTVPADNPFAGPQAPFFGYGVRNAFGLAVDPANGNLWDTENGEGAYDEINLVASGFNSGWLRIMGPADRDAQGTGDLVNLPESAYSDPEFSFLAPIGITSVQFLYGSSWGAAYDDAVLIGGSNGTNNEQLYLLRLNAARDGFVLTGSLADLVADSAGERNSLVFGEGFPVTTAMTRGADGAMYVTSLAGGTIYRIAPVPEPTTWLTLALGLGVLVLVRRRSR